MRKRITSWVDIQKYRHLIFKPKSKSVVNSIKHKLRIGITLTADMIPAWKCQLIKRIVQQDFVDTIGLVVLDHSGPTQGNSLWKKHLDLDTQYFKPQPDAFALNSIDEAFPNIPKIKLKELKEVALNLIIHLSDQAIPEIFYQIAAQGILSFIHGENSTSSEDFLGYWEFMRFQEVITSMLVLQTDAQESAKVVYRTWSMMPSLSMSRSRNEHMWKLAGLIPRALQEFHLNGSIRTLNTFDHIQRESLRANFPTHVEALINLSKHFFRMVFKAFRKLRYKEQWIILLNLQQGASTDFSTFKKLLPPKDRFWADPFLIEKNNKQYLFIEELPFETDKGHLSVIEIDEHGVSTPPVTILDKPYHLSYPFVFELENRYYMIPESYEDRSIQLYECKSFPFQWEHKMNLMSDISAFDTTLYFYNEKWWLFTVISEHKGSGHNDELFLFFADTPCTTAWKSHPQNPIVSDVRSARPAGNIYEKNGKLIRPSQDCARKYGYGFNLNEIELLTETTYREKRILHVRPDWDHSISRTHSFNHTAGATVIDAVIQRSRFF